MTRDHGHVHPDAAAGGAVRVLPCGDRALLAEVADLDAVAALHAALRSAPLPGQRELVPAARTVLVVLDRPPSETDVARLRGLTLADAPSMENTRTVELPVVFDGPDLAEVAALVGRPVAALVRALTDTEFTVAFG